MKYDYVDIGTCDFEVADGTFSKKKNYQELDEITDDLRFYFKGNKFLYDNLILYK